MGSDWYYINNASFYGVFIPRKFLTKDFVVPPGLSMGYINQNEYLTYAFLYVSDSLHQTQMHIPGSYDIMDNKVEISLMHSLQSRARYGEMEMILSAYKQMTENDDLEFPIGFWNVLSTYTLNIIHWKTGDTFTGMTIEDSLKTMKDIQKELGYDSDDESYGCGNFGYALDINL